MPLKVIYIDDEIGLCQSFVDNFESSAVVIKTFTDPQKGVEAIVADGADIVFLDYRLPDTNGDEVASKIPSNIPVVLISGDLSLEVGSRFLKVFGKPFDFDEMEALLRQLVEAKGEA